MSDLWEQINEAIDTDPLAIRDIVQAELAGKEREIEQLHDFFTAEKTLQRAATKRAERAEAERDRLKAVVRHFAAEAHRRKWGHEGTPAFDELHRLGNELLATLNPPKETP